MYKFAFFATCHTVAHVGSWSSIGASLPINRMSINHADLAHCIPLYKHKVPVTYESDSLIADHHFGDVLLCRWIHGVVKSLRATLSCLVAGSLERSGSLVCWRLLLCSIVAAVGLAIPEEKAWRHGFTVTLTPHCSESPMSSSIFMYSTYLYTHFHMEHEMCSCSNMMCMTEVGWKLGFKTWMTWRDLDGKIKGGIAWKGNGVFGWNKTM